MTTENYTDVQPVYRIIAGLVLAIENCERMGNSEWEVNHHERVEYLVNEYMPSGGGFDAGTSLNFDFSKPDRLVFDTSFHHMTQNGFYDGWTTHQVVVTPSLAFGMDVAVKGVNKNEIKEYIGDVFSGILDHKVNRQTDYAQLGVA